MEEIIRLMTPKAVMMPAASEKRNDAGCQEEDSLNGQTLTAPLSGLF
jgi:hypothetical protein